MKFICFLLIAVYSKALILKYESVDRMESGLKLTDSPSKQSKNILNFVTFNHKKNNGRVLPAKTYPTLDVTLLARNKYSSLQEYVNPSWESEPLNPKDYSGKSTNFSENESRLQRITYHNLLKMNSAFKPISASKKERFMPRIKTKTLLLISNGSDEKVHSYFVGKRLKQRSLKYPTLKVKVKRSNRTNIMKIPYTLPDTGKQNTETVKGLIASNQENISKKVLKSTSMKPFLNVQRLTSREVQPNGKTNNGNISDNDLTKKKSKTNVWKNVNNNSQHVMNMSEYGMLQEFGSELRKSQYPSDPEIAPDYEPVNSVFLNPYISQIIVNHPSEEINMKTLKNFKPLMPDYEYMFSRKAPSKNTKETDEEFDWYQTDDLYDHKLSDELTRETEFSEDDTESRTTTGPTLNNNYISTSKEIELSDYSAGMNKQIMVLGVQHAPNTEDKKQVTTNLLQITDIKYDNRPEIESMTHPFIPIRNLTDFEAMVSSDYGILESPNDEYYNYLNDISTVKNRNEASNKNSSPKPFDGEFLWSDLLLRGKLPHTTLTKSSTKKIKWVNWGKSKQIEEPTSSFFIPRMYKTEEESGELTKYILDEDYFEGEDLETPIDWLLWKLDNTTYIKETMSRTSKYKSNLEKEKEAKYNKLSTQETFQKTTYFLNSESRFSTTRRFENITVKKDQFKKWTSKIPEQKEEIVKADATNKIQTFATSSFESTTDKNLGTVLVGRDSATTGYRKMWSFKDFFNNYETGTPPTSITLISEHVVATTTLKVPTETRMFNFTDHPKTTPKKMYTQSPLMALDTESVMVTTSSKTEKPNTARISNIAINTTTPKKKNSPIYRKDKPKVWTSEKPKLKRETRKKDTAFKIKTDQKKFTSSKIIDGIYHVTIPDDKKSGTTEVRKLWKLPKSTDYSTVPKTITQPPLINVTSERVIVTSSSKTRRPTKLRISNYIVYSNIFPTQKYSSEARKDKLKVSTSNKPKLKEETAKADTEYIIKTDKSEFSSSKRIDGRNHVTILDGRNSRTTKFWKLWTQPHTTDSTQTGTQPSLLTLITKPITVITELPNKWRIFNFYVHSTTPKLSPGRPELVEDILKADTTNKIHTAKSVFSLFGSRPRTKLSNKTRVSNFIFHTITALNKKYPSRASRKIEIKNTPKALDRSKYLHEIEKEIKTVKNKKIKYVPSSFANISNGARLPKNWPIWLHSTSADRPRRVKPTYLRNYNSEVKVRNNTRNGKENINDEKYNTQDNLGSEEDETQTKPFLHSLDSARNQQIQSTTAMEPQHDDDVIDDIKNDEKALWPLWFRFDPRDFKSSDHSVLMSPMIPCTSLNSESESTNKITTKTTETVEACIETEGIYAVPPGEDISPSTEAGRIDAVLSAGDSIPSTLKDPSKSSRTTTTTEKPTSFNTVGSKTETEDISTQTDVTSFDPTETTTGTNRTNDETSGTDTESDEIISVPQGEEFIPSTSSEPTETSYQPAKVSKRRRCTCKAKVQTPSRPVITVPPAQEEYDYNLIQPESIVDYDTDPYEAPVPDYGPNYESQEDQKFENSRHDDDYYLDPRSLHKAKEAMCAPLLESSERRILSSTNLLVFISWLQIMRWVNCW